MANSAGPSSRKDKGQRIAYEKDIPNVMMRRKKRILVMMRSIQEMVKMLMRKMILI